MIMLAVDNRPDRLKELAACLQTAFPGAEIVDFTAPGLAVQYSFKNHVDVVFTEQAMRRLDGIQVAEGIHFFRPEAMIYLVTAAGAQARNTAHSDSIGCFTRPLIAADIRERVLADHEIWERRLRTKNFFIPNNSRPRGDEL